MTERTIPLCRQGSQNQNVIAKFSGIRVVSRMAANKRIAGGRGIMRQRLRMRVGEQRSHSALRVPGVSTMLNLTNGAEVVPLLERLGYALSVSLLATNFVIIAIAFSTLKICVE